MNIYNKLFGSKKTPEEIEEELKKHIENKDADAIAKMAGDAFMETFENSKRSNVESVEKKIDIENKNLTVKSNDLAENVSMFQFIKNKVSTLTNSLEIARKEKDINSYLKYDFLIYTLESIIDLSIFPLRIKRYQEQRKESLSNEYISRYNYIPKAFKNITINQSEYEIAEKEINKFIYIAFPVILGIPKDFFEKEYSEEDIKTFFQYKPFTDFRKINETPFEHYELIETFIDNTIKKILQ